MSYTHEAPTNVYSLFLITFFQRKRESIVCATILYLKWLSSGHGDSVVFSFGIYILYSFEFIFKNRFMWNKEKSVAIFR